MCTPQSRLEKAAPSAEEERGLIVIVKRGVGCSIEVSGEAREGEGEGRGGVKEGGEVRKPDHSPRSLYESTKRTDLSESAASPLDAPLLR